MSGLAIEEPEFPLNDQRKVYTCPVCGREDFKSARGLSAHVSRSHKADSGSVPVMKPERGDLIVDAGYINTVAILEMMFPGGIPYWKIADVALWCEATGRLNAK